MSLAEVSRAFRTHERAVWGVAWRVLGDPVAAEDIVQETFLRAVDRAPDRPHELRGWLVTVARNLARDELRRRRVRQRADPPDPDTVDAVARLGQDHDAVFRWLGTLSESHRRVVVLRDLLDHSPAEAARVLGTSPDTVRTLHLRARRHLRAAAAALPAGSPKEAVEHLLGWLVRGAIPGLPVREHEDDGADPITAWSGLLQAQVEVLGLAVDLCDGDPGLRARARLCRGVVLARLGELALAEDDFRGASAEATDRDDRRRAAERLGWARAVGGDPRGALTACEDALRFDPSPGAEAALRIQLAGTCRVLGQLDAAAEHLAIASRLVEGELGASRATGIGGPRLAMLLAFERGVTCIVRNAFQEGHEALVHARGWAERLGDAGLAAAITTNLAALERCRGDLGESRRWARDGLERGRAAGDRLVQANAHQHLAAAAVLDGAAAEAIAEAEAAIELHAALGAVPAVAVDQYWLAAGWLLAGRPAEATRVLDDAVPKFEAGFPMMTPTVSALWAAAQATGGDASAAVATLARAVAARGRLGPDPGDERMLELVGVWVDWCGGGRATAEVVRLLDEAPLDRFGELRVPHALMSAAILRGRG